MTLVLEVVFGRIYIIASSIAWFVKKNEGYTGEGKLNYRIIEDKNGDIVESDIRMNHWKLTLNHGTIKEWYFEEMYLVKGSLDVNTNHAKANCILIFESVDRINSWSCGPRR